MRALGNPDFSAGLAGRVQPPRVKHSAVDFEALQRALVEMFPYGPPVRIQVPNDTIDQVAVHMREQGRPGASIRCEDFGNALLKCAKESTGDVIDVRSKWKALYALPDRDFAPPPVILPFVVTATNFEDAMIWHSSTRPSLGLPAFDLLDAMQHRSKPMSENGEIPPAFLKQLAAIFGTPYEAMSVLDRMAMDPAPEGYGL